MGQQDSPLSSWSPKILTNVDHTDISQFFGIAKVDVLPPADLYHPLLPVPHDKLVFALCHSCVETEMSKPMNERSCYCNHSDAERVLRGTWCTPELEKAAQLGYVITKIHEVWHFEESQRGLFANYVNQWLKIKQESAGYPRWATTDEAKARYVQQYQEREGIALDPAMIAKNPGRKATAKLMLNSFWGKFGENLDKTSTIAVSTPAALFDVVSNPLWEIRTTRICNDEKLEIVYKDISANQIDNSKRNIFIAAFTTCWAHLKLYKYLEKLQKQVMYFDTDSVIYHWQPGQPEIALGDFLGDMTNEFDDPPKHPDDYGIEFVTAGPKNYGYRTADGVVKCKVRGLTLNFRGSQVLNFETMKRNVLDEIQDPLGKSRNIPVTNPHFFTRDPATKRLKVGPRTKKYGLVFDKRVIDRNTFMSYPYGYRRLSPENVDMAEMLCDL